MKSIYDFDPTFPNTEFRVGFIGSHCVGKTSQLKKLAQLLRIPTITEGVRHVIAAMGYRHISEVPDKPLFQWKVMQWQIYNEQALFPGSFLTDRTTLDNAAYFHRYNVDTISTREYWAYLDAAKAHAQSYTHLIYFPIAWDDVVADGFRDTDPAERREVDKVVRSLIDSFGVGKKVYTVMADDYRDGENARLIEILQHLNLWQTIRELGVSQEVTQP